MLSTESQWPISFRRLDEAERRYRLRRQQKKAGNPVGHETSANGLGESRMSVNLWTLPNGVKVSELCRSLLETLSSTDEQLRRQQQSPQKSNSPVASPHKSNDDIHCAEPSPSDIPTHTFVTTPTSPSISWKKRVETPPDGSAAAGTFQTSNGPESVEQLDALHAGAVKMPVQSALCWERKNHDDFIATLCKERNGIEGDNSSVIEQPAEQQERTNIIVDYSSTSKKKRKFFKLLASSESTKQGVTRSVSDSTTPTSRARSKVKARLHASGLDKSYEIESSKPERYNPTAVMNKSDRPISENLHFSLDSTTTEYEQPELSTSKASYDTQSPPDDNDSNITSSRRTKATNRKGILNFISTVMTKKRAKKEKPPESGKDQQNRQSKRASSAGKIMEKVTNESKLLYQSQFPISKSANIVNNVNGHLLHQRDLSHAKVSTDGERASSSTSSLESRRSHSLATKRVTNAETLTNRGPNNITNGNSRSAGELSNRTFDSHAPTYSGKVNRNVSVESRELSPETGVANPQHVGRIFEQFNSAEPTDKLDITNPTVDSQLLDDYSYGLYDSSLPPGGDTGAGDYNELSARTSANDRSACNDRSANGSELMHDTCDSITGIIEQDYHHPAAAAAAAAAAASAENHLTMTSFGDDVVHRGSSKQLTSDAEESLEAGTADNGPPRLMNGFVDKYSELGDEATQHLTGVDVDELQRLNEWNVNINEGPFEIATVESTVLPDCKVVKDSGLSAESLSTNGPFGSSSGQPVNKTKAMTGEELIARHASPRTVIDDDENGPTDNETSLHFESNNEPTTPVWSTHNGDMRPSLSGHDKADKSSAIPVAFETMFELFTDYEEPYTKTGWVGASDTDRSSDKSLIKITRNPFSNKIVIDFEAPITDSSWSTFDDDNSEEVGSRAPNYALTIDDGPNLRFTEPAAAIDRGVTSRDMAPRHHSDACEDIDSSEGRSQELLGDEISQFSAPTVDDHDDEMATPSATANVDDSNWIDIESSQHLLGTSFCDTKCPSEQYDTLCCTVTKSDEREEMTAAYGDDDRLGKCSEVDPHATESDVMTTFSHAERNMDASTSITESSLDSESLEMPDYRAFDPNFRTPAEPEESIQPLFRDDVSNDDDNFAQFSTVLSKNLSELNYIDNDSEVGCRTGDEWKTSAVLDYSDDEGNSSSSSSPSSSSDASDTEDITREAENVGYILLNEPAIPVDVHLHSASSKPSDGITSRQRSLADEKSVFLESSFDESSLLAEAFEEPGSLSSEDFRHVNQTLSAEISATVGDSATNRDENGRQSGPNVPAAGLDDLSTANHHIIADAFTFDVSTREALMCRGKDRQSRTDRKQPRSRQRRLVLLVRTVKTTVVVTEDVSIFPARNRELPVDDYIDVSGEPADEVLCEDGSITTAQKFLEQAEDSMLPAPTHVKLSTSDVQNREITDDDVVSASTGSLSYLTPSEDLTLTEEVDDYFSAESSFHTVPAAAATETMVFEQVVPDMTIDWCELDAVTCQSTPSPAPPFSNTEITLPEASVCEVPLWHELETETAFCRFDCSCLEDHQQESSSGEPHGDSHVVEFSDVIIHEYAEVISYFTDFVFVPVDRLLTTNELSGNELALLPVSPTASDPQNHVSSDHYGVPLPLTATAVQELSVVPYTSTSLSTITSPPEVVALLPRPPMTWIWSSSSSMLEAEAGIAAGSSAVQHIPFVSECYDVIRTAKTERCRLVLSSTSTPRSVCR